MLSIGNFAKTAQVSTRTIRYYESIGLLPKSFRSENNYRYYDQKCIERMSRIRDLQSLGFSLDEIKFIIDFSVAELKFYLSKQLLKIESEIINLEERQKRIHEILSVSNKMETGEVLAANERNVFMNHIQNELTELLNQHYNGLSDSGLAYLKRDRWTEASSHVQDLIEGIKKVILFAKSKNLRLGPSRGSSSASIALYGLGFSKIDPLQYEMIPERLESAVPSFHIDVEFEKGQEFVDYCREVNKSISYGEIQAFKMPLIDIVQNTHKAIGTEINYDSYADNSDVVLNPFKNRDFAKVFQFDFSPDSLVMSYEKFLPEYFGLDRMIEHFKGQTQFSFRDIVNITALWRPYCREIVDRIELY